MLNPIYPSKKPLPACGNPLCFDCLISPCEDAQRHDYASMKPGRWLTILNWAKARWLGKNPGKFLTVEQAAWVKYVGQHKRSFA